jgi:multisubunit Na+/H+ antiporter MnhE subunit
MLRPWLAWWVVCAALWLALVDRVPASELVAGAVVAAVGATGAVLVRRREGFVVWRPPRGAAGHALRQTAGLITDVPALLRVLWRRGVLRRAGHGALVERPFADLAPRAPRDVADRALIEALGSLAPATVVLDLDVERRVATEHRLEGA